MMNQLKGIHHVTAITSSAANIYQFYTTILGVRMVKKNVNQDDVKTYHLYFGDDRGSAGTAMTFFDFADIAQARHGTNEISRTSFRVPSDEANAYYKKRFAKYRVAYEPVTLFGHQMLFFEDFDGQPYALVSDEHNQGIGSGFPWERGPIPNEYAITGLGPAFLQVSRLAQMEALLVQRLGMRKTAVDGNLHQFMMGEGGNGATVIVEEDLHALPATQGYGGVHHLAFRVEDREELEAWQTNFDRYQMRHSGYVERFYFGSLYTRPYPEILFELATDGPGFIDDEESYEILGEKLTLPPHLRPYRQQIEEQLQPFDTVRSTKVFAKEYL